MNQVYIKKEDLNKWIARNLPNRDLISIEDLLATIEDMDSTIENLNEKLKEIEENIRDYYKPISPDEFYEVSERGY